MRTQIAEFPFRLHSENAFRRMLPMVRSGVTRRERAAIRLVLDASFVRPPNIVPLPDGQGSRANEYQVSLVRIANGTLDYGGVVGAFKGVEDEVAAFLGIDDGDPRFRCQFHQERGPLKFYAVRISVTDLSTGEDTKRVLDGFVAGVNGKRAPVKRAPGPVGRGPRYTPQEPLPFRYPPTRDR